MSDRKPRREARSGSASAGLAAGHGHRETVNDDVDIVGVPVFVNIFDYRMRPDADLALYQELGAEMYQRVTSDPRFPFIEMKGFATSPTEGVVIERFAALEGARLWASDPEHKRIKRRGQREFYAWYRGTACVVDHEYDHPSPVEA